jgi:hypothetical protein
MLKHGSVLDFFPDGAFEYRFDCKKYGHLQPGVNRGFINNLPGLIDSAHKNAQVLTGNEDAFEFDINAKH